jgi:hypothetical protein
VGLENQAKPHFTPGTAGPPSRPQWTRHASKRSKNYNKKAETTQDATPPPYTSYRRYFRNGREKLRGWTSTSHRRPLHQQPRPLSEQRQDCTRESPAATRRAQCRQSRHQLQRHRRRSAPRNPIPTVNRVPQDCDPKYHQHLSRNNGDPLI